MKYETSDDWYLVCPSCSHEIPFEFTKPVKIDDVVENTPKLSNHLGGLSRRTKTMNNFKAMFVRERTTKNTVRYEELLEDELDSPKIGKLYIQKSALAEIGSTIPDRLFVIVANAAEEENNGEDREETVLRRVQD